MQNEIKERFVGISITDRIDMMDRMVVTDLHGISIELFAAILVLIQKDWLALSPKHDIEQKGIRDRRKECGNRNRVGVECDRE
jgi:hypothetical protein